MTRLALLCAVLLPGLAGCAGLLSWSPPPQREVHNQSAALVLPERPVASGDYMVRAGDTMYSIAFRNNLDFRELARWNSIGADFLIRPGQVLRLAAPPRVALREGDIVSHPEEVTPPPAAQPIALPTESIGVPPADGLNTPKPSPPVVVHAPSVPVPPVVASAPVAGPAAPAPLLPPPPPPLTSESGGAYRWQWPTEGVVVRGYNPAVGSKGLDFTGSIGQSVVAAAPGKVVYSGSALKGYGELIIIKHDDLRLSAYGYNRTRLVNEGQMVRGGQPIAELGLGPENKPVLHFEIRERGQPVDPVPYLPAKTARN